MNNRRLRQDAAPYVGPDRRADTGSRIEAIERRQTSIMQDIDLVKVELKANTAVTQRVMEILEAPATFWAWCAKWGRRVSLFAKVVAPIIALFIALDQFMHIDIGGAIRRLFFSK